MEQHKLRCGFPVVILLISLLALGAPSAHPAQSAITKNQEATTPEKQNPLKIKPPFVADFTVTHAQRFQTSNLRFELLKGSTSILYTGDGTLTLENGLLLRVRQTQVLVDNNPDGSAHLTIIPANSFNGLAKQQ